MYAIFEYDVCVYCCFAASAQHAEQKYRDLFGVYWDAPIYVQKIE